MLHTHRMLSHPSLARERLALGKLNYKENLSACFVFFPFIIIIIIIIFEGKLMFGCKLMREGSKSKGRGEKMGGGNDFTAAKTTIDYLYMKVSAKLIHPHKWETCKFTN